MVDVRLPGKGNSNSHGARPVHLINTMIKWIRTRRLSIKNALSLSEQDVMQSYKIELREVQKGVCPAPFVSSYTSILGGI